MIALFLIAVFPMATTLPDEEEKGGLVEWQAEQPLTWADFSGDIDTESPYDAWTWSGINYVYSWFYEGDDIKIDLNAYAFFDPAQSWVKNGEKSAELLAHEQLHFDISEMHCRYFEEAVHDFDFTENVEAELDSIYNVYFDQLLATQIKYDEESEHYQNAEGQMHWNNFVASELKRLE